MATLGTLVHMKNINFILEALSEAKKAYLEDEVPIGALIVSPEGTIITRAHNRVEQDKDPSAHAELLAIRAAAHLLKSPRLIGHTLYTTLEPCPMCAQLIAFARLKTVCFGALDPKGGGVLHGPRIFEQSSCHHRPEVISAVEADACGQILKDFFQEKRALKKR